MPKKWSVALICVIAFLVQPVLAATPGVIVTPKEQTYTSEGIQVELVLEFVDTELYHEEIYMSYHILDMSGDMLYREGQRIPIPPMQDGVSYVNFSVACANIPEISEEEKVEIQFDIVDQKNSYWFLDKGLIEQQGEPVYFDRSMLLSQPEETAGTTDQIGTASVDPISLALNIFVWVGVVAALLKYRRSQKNLENQPKEIRTSADRVEFISLLRAVACIIVIWAHYVCMFAVNGVNEVFPYILPKEQPTSMLLRDFVVSTTDAISINAGSLGVAIFFLITGFTTIYSLSAKPTTTKEFVLGKAIRIYPPYIVGVFVLYLFTLLYTQWAGTTPPEGKLFLAQATLFRDWMWLPSVDGIGWTLEEQLKMYAFLFILYKLKVFRSPKWVASIAAVCGISIAILSPVANIYAATSPRKYTVCYVLMMGIVYCSYSLIGAVLCQFYLKQWDKKLSYYTLFACIASFVFALYTSKLGNTTTTVSYLIAVVLFVLAYDLRKYWKIGFVLKFIEKISFSLYIVHGVNGYYMLSFLDRVGVPPFIALPFTVAVAIILAWLMYQIVEKPCNKLAKAVGHHNK